MSSSTPKLKTYRIHVERYSEERIRNHMNVQALNEEDATRRVEKLLNHSSLPWYEPAKCGGNDEWRDKHWESDYYPIGDAEEVFISPKEPQLSDADWNQLVIDLEIEPLHDEDGRLDKP